MKKTKKGIAQRSDFSNDFDAPTPSTFALDSASLPTSQSTHLTSHNHQSQLQPNHKQQPSHPTPNNEITPSATIDDAGDERKKRLQALRQKYLKTKPRGQGEAGQPQPTKTETRDSQREIQPISKPTGQKTELSHATWDAQQNKTTVVAEPKEEPVSQKVQKKPSIPPPPPRRGTAPPPPPIRRPIEKVEPKLKQQEPTNGVIEIPQPNNNDHEVPLQRQVSAIQKQPSPQALPAKLPRKPSNPTKASPERIKAKLTLIQTPVEPASSEKQPLKPAIQKWLNGSRQLSSDAGSIQATHQALMNELLHLFGDNSSIAGFIFNFGIKNEHELSDCQSSFIQSFLAQLQEHHHDPTQKLVSQADVLLLLLIKCGIKALSSHQELFTLQQAKRVSRNRSVLLRKQKQDYIRLCLNQQEPSWELILQLIDLCPSSPQICAHIAQSGELGSPLQSVTALRLMKGQLDEKNVSMYFKFLNHVLPFVQDSSLLEEITKQINSVTIPTAYQLKKDSLLKAIQLMSSTEEQPHLETTKSEGTGGINLMGYVNQAIKKIKSQVPQKKVEEEEGPKDSIVWDNQLKRYLINGVVPDDDSGVKTESQQVKKPPPPPPRNIRKNPPPPSPPADPIVALQTTPAHIEAQTPKKNGESLEQAGSRVPVRPMPPPPPRAGIKAVSRKPRYA